MSAHAGFDRSDYPGNDLMQWLWRHTNLAWTGFYLAPAPSHPNAGWMGTRDFLRGLGWGFAPLYLGQQAQGPGSHVLNSLQGYFDGIDATNLALRAGFPSHSVIYLDIEQGPPLGQPTADYYRTWVQAVLDQGYYPGVYFSFLIASQLDAIDLARSPGHSTLHFRGRPTKIPCQILILRVRVTLALPFGNWRSSVTFKFRMIMVCLEYFLLSI